MSEIEAELPAAFDPFAEANAEDSGAGAKEYVHVRIQQRNGRKSLTTVQGLKKEFSYNKILKDLKKDFCCNGTVVEDPELGQVIQLQGDQRKNVANFLVQVISPVIILNLHNFLHRTEEKFITFHQLSIRKKICWYWRIQVEVQPPFLCSTSAKLMMKVMLNINFLE
ncbi:Translation initiation factor SUI1 family protein [Rhynchospora pubera]|uniref:Protein translation factor SUI1 homolog n=1 Tax=Rhynchospora pubera TaxID=906938 RepID=A0AAV8DA66_9POAL|nr:Translation initiation factor SUI1 family protein [Rhynchospora pubera]